MKIKHNVIMSEKYVIFLNLSRENMLNIFQTCIYRISLALLGIVIIPFILLNVSLGLREKSTQVMYQFFSSLLQSTEWECVDKGLANFADNKDKGNST